MANTSKKKKDPKWKKFEKVVAGIHILRDREAIVKFNDRIQGRRTGRKQQVDVSVRFKKGFYSYLIIIECKNLTRGVEIGDVQAFATKMDDLGADKGIMVSANFFQEGAIATAEQYKVELHNLTEEPGEWIEKITVPIQSFAFPVNFTINAKDDPGYSGWENTSLDDFVFYKQNGTSIPMRELIDDVMAEAVRKRKHYPLRVRWQFIEPMRIHLPGYQSATEAYWVDFEIGDGEFQKESRDIPVTPQGISYVYSNLHQKERNIFPAERLPIGVGTIFEPGNYYKNTLEMKYRCLKVEGDMVTLLLLDWKERGGTYDIEFETGIESAQDCVLLDDPEEQRRLEQRYKALISDS